ncbi:MAG: hypothetical protein IJ901_00025 [Bacteroidaceae bacterium]|nr:hypothetical protein [Bacteroidaceae bacterium]
MQCHCGGKVLPLRWHCIASRVAQFSQPSGRTMRRQWHSSPTEVGELCH